MTPPVVCVVGKKNSGKTTHVVALAAELTRRGRRVMTVKHGHGFDFDRQGSDSWRHRHEGGAGRVVLAAPDGVAMFGDWPEGEMTLGEILDRFLGDAELVIAEGYKREARPKVEIFREAADPEPIYPTDPEGTGRYLALVTDSTDLHVPFPVLELGDPELAAKLADIVETALLP